MNDRPEQWNWPEPVQDEMSAEDFAVILQEMKKDPGYEAGLARRLAALKELQALFRDHASDPPVLDEPGDPEPVQDEMSAEDFAMIVQEMKKDPGYEAGRLRRLAAAMALHECLRDCPGIPADGLGFMRDDEGNEE